MTHSHDTATPALSVEREEALSFTYTNWRGETALRRVRAKGACFRFGSTEWHPEPQWLLSAIDLDKMEGRDFAVRDIVFAAPAPNPSPAAKGGEAGAMFEHGADLIDLPSKIAVEIMSLDWTHGGTAEEHCNRYGHLQEIIEAALATPSPQPADAVREAAKAVIKSATNTYRKRNGQTGTIEGDDGEMAWIVPFDPFEELRAALASDPAPAGEAVEPDDLTAAYMAGVERGRDDREKLVDQNRHLTRLLYLADEAIMKLHGCFPNDEVTEEQRHLKHTCKAIRAVTGGDFLNRRRRVEAARAALATEASR